MSTHAMNKSVLAQRRRELEAYARVLPSLDLKRRQLAAILAEEQHRQQQAEAALQAGLQAAAQGLPMLAREAAALDELLQLLPLESEQQEAEEKVLGVALPRVGKPRWAPISYEFVATPFWLEAAVDALKELGALQMEIRTRQARIERLRFAVRRTLQRVNLFEKVLMPRARADIHAIRVFVADAERGAIVRAKRARAALHDLSA